MSLFYFIVTKNIVKYVRIVANLRHLLLWNHLLIFWKIDKLLHYCKRIAIHKSPKIVIPHLMRDHISPTSNTENNPQISPGDYQKSLPISVMIPDTSEITRRSGMTTRESSTGCEDFSAKISDYSATKQYIFIVERHRLAWSNCPNRLEKFHRSPVDLL